LFLEIWTNINLDQDHKPSRSSHVRMNAEISETFKCRKLGLAMQISFISAECNFHSDAHNRR